MSFEKWITNMSPGEMIPLIIGLSVSILFMMATYFTIVTTKVSENLFKTRTLARRLTEVAD